MQLSTMIMLFFSGGNACVVNPGELCHPKLFGGQRAGKGHQSLGSRRSSCVRTAFIMMVASFFRILRFVATSSRVTTADVRSHWVFPGLCHLPNVLWQILEDFLLGIMI